jgi:predicted nuclease of predicted toxin-antitoxin system
MQFLADENCDSLVVQAIREAGHNVEYVAEFSPGDEDVDILARSFANQRVLITEDLDFCELVFRDEKPAYAIVLIRIIPRSLKVKRVLELIDRHSENLAGNFASLTADDVRLRSLPI